MRFISETVKGELGEGFVKAFIAANWVLTGVLGLVCALFASQEMALGILVGGMIANFNCMGLDRDCRRAVRWGSVAAYYGGFAVRIGLIALAVTCAFLFFRDHFSPIGLFIGLSVGVANFYILVLVMLINKVRMKEAS